MRAARSARRASPAWLVALVLAGCSATEGRRQQLERVARDWCLTIRASQVIPVYPLTEDLQPGDIFLVRRTLANEAAFFDQRGYLPLDLHAGRLAVQEQLAGSFDNPLAKLSSATAGERGLSLVGFPTYEVAVDREAGLDLALPIQAVPVALGLLHTSQARASVALQDAFTYGVDAIVVSDLAMQWLETNAAKVERLLPRDTTAPRHLRVITRVYLVRGITVAAASTSSTKVDAAASAPPAAAEIGGRLQLLNRTDRSVVLQETFQRPIVVGYQAVEIPLDPSESGARRGSTFETLTGPEASVEHGADATTDRLRVWLKADSAHPDRLEAWLESAGPAGMTVVELLNGPHGALRQRAIAELGVH